MINPGQAVSAANVNAAFISRTADSTTTGKLGLLNPDTDSIPELQLFLNHIIEVLGLLTSAADLVFDDPEYLTNGMSVTEAFNALDAELAAVNAAFNNIFGTANEWTGNQKFSGTVDYGFFNDTLTTGSNQVLDVPSKIIVRLQNGTLASVSGIESPAATRLLVLLNDTGAALVIKDFDTVNAALGEYIRTGVNNDITMQDQSALLLIYDETAGLWQIVGGSGSGGSGSGGGTSLNFRAPGLDGAVIDEDSDLPVFVFEPGLNQRIIGMVQVPDSYNPGFQPYVRIPSICFSADKHAYQVRTTLLKPTLQAINDTTYVASVTSSDFGLAGANILETRDVVLSSVSGQVNGGDILAGDYLKIEIIRTAPVGTEALLNSKVLHESIGVFFA